MKKITFKMRAVIPIVVILAAVLIVFLLMLMRPSPEKKANSEKAWHVTVETVRPRDYTPRVTLYGSVESPRAATLEAAVEADVLAVSVRDGERVKKDQLLVQLDDRDAVLLLQQRQAEVADLEAQIKAEKRRYQADQESLVDEKDLMDLAQKSLDRQAHLKEKLAGSQAQLDAAQEELRRRSLMVTDREMKLADYDHRLAQLQAKLQRAEALEKQAMLDVERTRIRAPFSGRVTDVKVSVGDRVQDGEALLDMFDTEDVEVRAQIPTDYLAAVRHALASGEHPDAYADYDGEKIILQLERLSGQVDRGKAGVDGFFRVTEGSKRLALGRTLLLHHDLATIPNSIAIPRHAIYGADRIYKVVGDRLVPVKITRLGNIVLANGEERIVITSDALQEGDEYIVTQLPNAVTGLKVKAFRETP